MSVLPSYINQSVDLNSKSIDWFLYEGNTGIKFSHGFTLAAFFINESNDTDKSILDPTSSILISFFNLQSNSSYYPESLVLPCVSLST